jgi:hypothetical protein
MFINWSLRNLVPTSTYFLRTHGGWLYNLCMGKSDALVPTEQQNHVCCFFVADAVKAESLMLSPTRPMR